MEISDGRHGRLRVAVFPVWCAALNCSLDFRGLCLCCCCSRGGVGKNTPQGGMIRPFFLSVSGVTPTRHTGPVRNRETDRQIDRANKRLKIVFFNPKAAYNRTQQRRVRANPGSSGPKYSEQRHGKAQVSSRHYTSSSHTAKENQRTQKLLVTSRHLSCDWKPCRHKISVPRLCGLPESRLNTAEFMAHLSLQTLSYCARK